MAFVQDILEAKGDAVHSLSSGDMVIDALEMMARHNIGAVPVVDDDQLAGIFTERLYARNVFLKGRASPNTRLADVMVRDVITVAPDATVEMCMSLMNDKQIRHLPVLANNRIVGLVSVGDLMNRIIEDREFDVEQLVDYIGR